MLLLGVGSAFAQADLLSFSVLSEDDKTAMVNYRNFSGPVASLQIPEKVNIEGTEYTVVAIGRDAFNTAEVESVNIPATIKTIGNGAFCYSTLKNVTFNGGLDLIEESAFTGTDIESFEIPGDVGEIQLYAFGNPKSIKIDGNVSLLGDHSIAGCRLLEDFSVTGNIEEIGELAFLDCNNLSKISVDGYIKTIGGNAFSGTAITDFVFNEGLESIELPLCGNGSFSLTLPQSFKEFKGGYTVNDGEKVLNLKWYDSLMGIEKITFNVTDLEAWCTTPIAGYNPKKYGWTDHYNSEAGKYEESTIDFVSEFIPVTINYRGREITSLSVPMGVETLKPYAFAGLENLTSVSLPDGLKEIGEGVFGGTAISAIELPESVVTIGDYAFACDADIQEIELPAGLTTLGDYAFYKNIGLYEVEIPGGVKRIGAHAFDQCIDMENITLNEGLEEVGAYAFYAAKRVAEIKFPESLVSIEEHAFNGIAATELEFGDNLKSIGNWAFSRFHDGFDFNFADWVDAWGNSPTCKINLGKSIESIGDYAFAVWTIRSIQFPETLTSIGSFAFRDSKLSTITLPTAMTELSKSAFEGCGNLAVVNFSEALETIGARAFANTSLRDLNLPTSVKEIGEYAFENTPVVNAVIPDGVTSIGEKAFTNVNYLTIGSGITSISKPVAQSCDILKMTRPTPPTLSTDRLGFEPKVVIVPAEAGDTYRKNNRWKDYNIFAEGENKAIVNVNKEANEQLADQLILQSRLMPAQVASLAVYGSLDNDDWAVIRSNMTSLYDLDLSNISNTEIPAEALNGKSTLLNVTLPDGLKTIGNSAFSGCTLMHMPQIPSSLESIGENAFGYCKSLDSDWIFTASLASVGKKAFLGCESLKGLDFSETAITNFADGDGNGSYFQMETGVFENTYSLSKLIFPTNLERIPSGAFKNSGIRTVEIPASVKAIGMYSFQNSSIEKIEIPEGVEEIGAFAFNESNLEAISLPASLRTLGEYTFSSTPLVYADFADGLGTVADGVFKNCQDLMVVNLPTTLKSIGENAIAASALAAINAPIVDPAATVANPFTGVDNMTCALSIPRQSFTKYVRAEYWGSFVGVRNNIDVTIPETVEVTYIDEDDYQEMIEDMQEEEETPEQPVSARRRAMRVLRANAVISSFKGYGKLFNGAALYRDDKGKTRFFLDIDPAEIGLVKVEYNNKDITSQIDSETMSFVTEPLTMNATLKVTYDGVNVGVEEIEEGAFAAPVDVYDLTGRLVLVQATDFSSLPAGIYIAGGKKIMVK